MDTTQNCRNLIAAVLYKAALDYQTPRFKKDVTTFLGSKWGKHLCEMINLNPSMVLERLESGEVQIKEEEEL